MCNLNVSKNIYVIFLKYILYVSTLLRIHINTYCYTKFLVTYIIFNKLEGSTMDNWVKLKLSRLTWVCNFNPGHIQAIIDTGYWV